MYKPKLTRDHKGIKVKRPSEVADSDYVHVYDGEVQWHKVKHEFTDAMHYIRVIGSPRQYKAWCKKMHKIKEDRDKCTN